MGTVAACTYDDCQTDRDCPSGVLCVCGASYLGRNACLPGNCHDDADCSGTQCGSVPGETTGGSLPNGHYCRTSRDKCKDAASCGPNKACGYVTSTSRWECVAVILPPPG
jgi:hypothetical protein